MAIITIFFDDNNIGVFECARSVNVTFSLVLKLKLVLLFFYV